MQRGSGQWQPHHPNGKRTDLRIGTWNLEGKWSASHLALVTDLVCDVWLLTEVRRDANVAGWHSHLTSADMQPGRAWAGVLSREPLTPAADPHPASAVASVAGITYCASILPWKGSGDRKPWIGRDHAERTGNALADLRAALSPGVVWGGDFNHAMEGREYAGGLAGRAQIRRLLDDLGLTLPTRRLPHRNADLLTIDHIAVPDGTEVAGVEHHDATGLSDHDAYVVTVGISAR